MIWLKYHLDEDDYNMPRFVYLINMLRGVHEKVCRVKLEGGRKVFFENDFYRKAKKYAMKDLVPPAEEFGPAGKNLYDSLFLYCNSEIEYYWHRDPEKVLEEILAKGKDYLTILAA